jgi:hypothetical protein
MIAAVKSLDFGCSRMLLILVNFRLDIDMHSSH